MSGSLADAAARSRARRRQTKTRTIIPRGGPNRLQCTIGFIVLIFVGLSVSALFRVYGRHAIDDHNGDSVEMTSDSVQLHGVRGSVPSVTNREYSKLGLSNSKKDLEMSLDDIPDPVIERSHFARVFNKEPFQQTGIKSWGLHTIPTNEWFDRAQAVREKCDLTTPYQEHAEYTDEITIVATLLDLKRGKIGNKMFHRGMDEYFSRFNRILRHGWPMVIYMPEEFREHLQIQSDRHHVIPFTIDDLRSYFPYWNRLEEIRLSELWMRQGKEIGWLGDSPQAKLQGYNPLVMSKIFMLRDAARLNPFKTKNFMFLDSGHMCATEIHPGETPVFERHMDKFFVTHWPYGTATEVHGFNDKALHLYMGTAKDPMQIVRGGVFGGQRPYIECVTKLYQIVLAQTLQDGYMGTEENILAILFAKFPDLFHGFDNNSRGNHGDNCASFAASLEEVRKAKKADSWVPKPWMSKYAPGAYTAN